MMFTCINRPILAKRYLTSCLRGYYRASKKRKIWIIGRWDYYYPENFHPSKTLAFSKSLNAFCPTEVCLRNGEERFCREDISYHTDIWGKFKGLKKINIFYIYDLTFILLSRLKITGSLFLTQLYTNRLFSLNYFTILVLLVLVFVLRTIRVTFLDTTYLKIIYVTLFIGLNKNHMIMYINIL